MNNSATMEKMRSLRLHGMLKAFETSLENPMGSKLTNDELAAYLVEAEWDDRRNRKFNRLWLQAKFRYKASMAELDYSPARQLDKNQILRLADCSWIMKKQNVLITGPTGAGKSFMVSALGHQACLNGYKVYYGNGLKLFSNLKMAQADGTYQHELTRIRRADVFILDDFGIQPLDKQNSLIFLEILEDRSEEKSTVISSQLSIKNWHQSIGEHAVADAICDRLIHTALRVELKGVDSMRKIKKR